MRETHTTLAPQHRTAKGAQRVQDLTTVATELFLERGFEAVAVDDLIARVGGSRRNVYSHFGGKEGLFIEAITKLCGDIAQPLKHLDIGEGGAREALRSFGIALLQTVMTPRTLEVHRLMVAEGRRFPALAQAVFHAGHAQAADVLAPWIARHQKTRSRKQGDMLPAHVLAQYFVNMVVMEAQLQALTGLTAVPLPNQQARDIVDNAVTVFLDGASL